MTLNEKIGVILKQHKEGEEFFNALDFMIKGDRSILEDFLSFFMNDAVERCRICGKPVYKNGLCKKCNELWQDNKEFIVPQTI